MLKLYKDFGDLKILLNSRDFSREMKAINNN